MKILNGRGVMLRAYHLFPLKLILPPENKYDFYAYICHKIIINFIEMRNSPKFSKNVEQ